MSPSANIPHIPYTDLNETLKIYGEAEVTVSELNAKVAPATEGRGVIGAFWTIYFASVSLGLSDTTNWPSYPAALIPSIRKGVSTCNPSTAELVVTVIVVVAVTPSPDLILEIPTDLPVEPTILYSSILGWISIPEDG